MKQQIWLGILGVVIVTLACTVGVGLFPTPTPVDEVGTIVATTMQAFTQVASESAATEVPTQTDGVPVSFEHVSLVIPNGVGEGANTEKMTAVSSNDVAPWEVGPTHLRFTLTGYQLEDKFHEPRIFVYPAEEYAQSNPNAAEQIDRLRKISAGTALMKETLPTVPFFNAAPLIAAHINIISFQNGSGVRALTQYAQYAAPINNRELFYHFQALTNDGRYYVIAILPVTAPVLAEDEKTEAPVPAEGVPVPTDVGPNDIYYFSVREKLNALSPDEYTPPLDALDALVQSILVTNP